MGFYSYLLTWALIAAFLPFLVWMIPLDPTNGIDEWNKIKWAFILDVIFVLPLFGISCFHFLAYYHVKWASL